jgi:hypothetical protein
MLEVLISTSKVRDISTNGQCTNPPQYYAEVPYNTPDHILLWTSNTNRIQCYTPVQLQLRTTWTLHRTPACTHTSLWISTTNYENSFRIPTNIRLFNNSHGLLRKYQHWSRQSHHPRHSNHNTRGNDGTTKRLHLQGLLPIDHSV